MKGRQNERSYDKNEATNMSNRHKYLNVHHKFPFLSNKLGNEHVYKFIKQKTDEIFKKNRFLAKVSNFVTDFGSKVNILKEGASYSSKKKGRKSSRRKSIV